MKRTAILACLLLAACAGSRADIETPAQSVDLTADLRSNIEQGVRSGLKDPDSARFGTMKVAIKRDDPETYVVCGWVNSKNSFGGYTGEQPFLAMYAVPAKGAVLIGTGGTRTESTVIMSECARYGVPFGA